MTERLIVPVLAFGTLLEVVEYLPCIAELKITAGIGGIGLKVYTVVTRIAIPTLSGQSGGSGGRNVLQ